MNKHVKNTVTKLLILLITLIVVLVGSLFIIFKDDYFKDIVNSCRVIVSEDLINISKAYEDHEETNVETIYTYTIVNLDGKIIKTIEDEKRDYIPLNELSFDNWYEVNNKQVVRYSAPLIREGEIKEIVIFTIPKDDILKIRGDGRGFIWYIPSIVIFLAIMFIIHKIYRIINVDILVPINEMHNSAIEILKGNYFEKIKYDYQGEIGEFSHDFERMRDSLKVSREREETLKKAEKELLACISHDLKTPISNISGYCEGILDGVVKEENQIKRYAGIILKKSKVLTKLLDDMLEFSKAEINQMSIKKQEVYSMEFFKGLLDEISMDVISSGREFIINREVPNLLINLDGDRIGQVLNNIISNSIKYTSDKGIITISFKKLKDGLEVSLNDDGVGIASEELPFVFNKFYRGEKHRNQNIPGSGLGLSIAKYIIEMHKGNIEVRSYKEKGTIVTFSINN
ncbi:HAMP domain-containing histidine kinase [Clostridium gasigenes]|uniref:sensor histidine kinase n=1 Tax=Clostridium gasigenes TaxID=94869 RepID=UPI001438654F|nr:HAMP domain-containing sensor histidine kinase [Clostridium gasigenes]NKF05814.1 HAMP domain-containing histidine kinase [Clostridium gasigenes]QSW19453.1 HAMP domain-containing histidine kinase [Clostridium gasigenes]